MRRHLALVVSISIGCSSGQRTAPAARDDLAERYVKLVLALGVHDPAEVDAYYGPAEWKTEAAKAKRSLGDIRTESAALLVRAKALPAAGDDLEAKRARYFVAHLEALIARVEMVGGKKLRFDDESRRLFGVVTPKVAQSRIDEIHARLDKLVPGSGPLHERVEAVARKYVVPRERVEAVFSAAIAECRVRTLRHISLPASESFTVEYVKNQPWLAYNWYKGDYRSVIQVNTDLPFTIDGAIQLACHEGYPGHHVYNSLLERDLVRGRGYSEISVYPLFSPTSLIAEGSADYGIELAFRGSERTEFELRVLFPLAGLATEGGREYLELVSLLEELDDARDHGVRLYVDGELDAAAAESYFVRQRLETPERAKKFLEFIGPNRSYAITYNVGRSLIREHVERAGGTGDGADERRWAAFVKILSTPTLASDLAR